MEGMSHSGRPHVFPEERELIMEEVINRLPQLNLESDDYDRIVWRDDYYQHELQKSVLFGHQFLPKGSPYHRLVELKYHRNNFHLVKRKREYDGCTIFIYRADYPDANKHRWKHGLEKDGWFFQFGKRRRRR